MRLGLVSDSHGLADPGLPRLFEGCALILHAGDVVAAEVLAPLRAVAPVRAVRGNNDTAAGVRDLPEALRLDLDGVPALLIHQLGAPGRLLPEAARLVAEARPRLVISGHSHAPHAALEGGVLYLNPGSAGPRRFSLPRAAALLHLEAGQARFELHDLARPGLPPLAPPRTFPLAG